MAAKNKSIPSSNDHILITADWKMNRVKIIIFTQNIEYRGWACLVQNVLREWLYSLAPAYSNTGGPNNNVNCKSHRPYSTVNTLN